MDAVEFANLQEALLWALGPSALWVFTLLLASSIFAALMIPVLALARKLTGR